MVACYARRYLGQSGCRTVMCDVYEYHSSLLFLKLAFRQPRSEHPQLKRQAAAEVNYLDRSSVSILCDHNVSGSMQGFRRTFAPDHNKDRKIQRLSSFYLVCLSSGCLVREGLS